VGPLFLAAGAGFLSTSAYTGDSALVVGSGVSSYSEGVCCEGAGRDFFFLGCFSTRPVLVVMGFSSGSGSGVACFTNALESIGGRGQALPLLNTFLSPS